MSDTGSVSSKGSTSSKSSSSCEDTATKEKSKDKGTARATQSSEPDTNLAPNTKQCNSKQDKETPNSSLKDKERKATINSNKANIGQGNETTGDSKQSHGKDREETRDNPVTETSKADKRVPTQVKYKDHNQVIKEELDRIKTQMKKNFHANASKRPNRKQYQPFVWNSLHPYSDTYAIDYLLEQPTVVHHIYKTRQTASQIVDPEISWKMDNFLQGPLLPSTSNHSGNRKEAKKPSEDGPVRSRSTRRERECSRMHLDQNLSHHRALQRSMKLACMAYMDQSKSTAKRNKGRTDFHDKTQESKVSNQG
ncbi:uncharacterized protein LOC136758917 [Amia ocellicauda]|uniref:uncharacterized protein LOC136758917 n=1 Tax=Amia ocellicauda TaxID=2972642 RepID=UPI0034638A21